MCAVSLPVGRRVAASCHATAMQIVRLHVLYVSCLSAGHTCHVSKLPVRWPHAAFATHLFILPVSREDLRTRVFILLVLSTPWSLSESCHKLQLAPSESCHNCTSGGSVGVGDGGSGSVEPLCFFFGFGPFLLVAKHEHLARAPTVSLVKRNRVCVVHAHLHEPGKESTQSGRTDN